MITFEERNTEAYRLLMRIEIAIREVLRQSLENTHGNQWRKQLPKDLRTKIHEATTEEDRRRQFDFVRLGPLYYLTFGELLTILHQNSALEALNRLGGTTVREQLVNLLAPRNALAHSRAVSPTGLTCITAVYSQIASALTQEELERILASPDVGARPEEVIPQLIQWLNDVKVRFAALAPECAIHSAYNIAIIQYWWELPEAASFDHSAVDEVARLVRAYNALPSGMGSAATRQRFLEHNGALNKLDVALRTLHGAS